MRRGGGRQGGGGRCGGGGGGGRVGWISGKVGAGVRRRKR